MFKIATITGLILLQTTFASASSQTGLEEFETAASAWQLPFASPHRLVRQYLQPNSDYSAGHRGVDFAGSVGDELLAPADGIITVAKQIVNRPIIAIKNGIQIVTELEPACTSLPVGSQVRKGEPIGRVCLAGPDYKQHCAVETCIHFSLRVNGQYLSPLKLIGGLNPSRLISELSSAPAQARG
jgi:murein DD-endopeptidase MepM/ murein hydrolase activator NlpD